jgi:phage tail sheath protein FI
MPEYLAPAVYVEEVDTGSKPIEGVSTSTAGMLGVTERGPVNMPMLVTSFGEYQRLFGQMLSAARYAGHRFLPNAIEGFFTNGGKRVFVTRVLDVAAAVPSARRLVAPVVGAAVQARTVLPAAPTASSVVIEADPGFVALDTIQIDDGLSSEFQQVQAVPAAAATVTVRLPLDFSHDPALAVEHRAIGDAGPPAQNTTTLSAPVTAGATTIQITAVAVFNPVLVADQVLRVGTLAADEELVVLAGPPAGTTLTLRAPLHLDHDNGAQVVRQTVGAIIPTARQIAAGNPASANAAVILADLNGGLTTEDDGVRFAGADPTRDEYRRIGALSRLPLDQPTYAAYPAGTTIARMTPGAGTTIVNLTRDAAAGDTVIGVDQRVGFNDGLLVQIGVGTQAEILQIVGTPPVGSPPNPGNLVLRGPLRFPHPIVGSPVQLFAAPSLPTRQAVVTLDSPDGSPAISISRSTFAAADLIRVTPPTGGPYFHTVAAGGSAAINPVAVPIVNPLEQAHAAGVLVSRRVAFADVRAIDAGQWGDRLQVAMERQDPPLLTTTVRQKLPGGRLKLASAAGVETGTELVIDDGAGNVVSVKVASIDLQNDYLITLEAAPPLPGWVAALNLVTTREYRFVVELLRQPDPSNPARNSIAIDREAFANLSLDRRHSRYFERIIGCTWNTTSSATTADDRGQLLRRADHRSEGESQYVRVFDSGFATSTGVRPGPVATYAQRPGGTPRLLLLPLHNGNDALGSITDLTYIGTDDVNPELRTGLFTLRNLEDISIVAAPGRTSVAMQNALINHCELMRYRFAVLDGQAPPVDSIPDIQLQRQQFDTKYAALYHPWLLVPDPFPANGTIRQDYAIPPAGHMVGIYARTDIERGVHKAPANEVVRGVVGLQRVLNKEQHDILNPYPVNINVIRDFRTNNRGIRVYGGRVITSDSDWKYVNVRRLLIFIEASIDRGLQWVVFEPNAEPLWARVRRAISNFLTIVWRNGALEGTKPEEAYFVKCDRTTMTQTDIDQGRLIVLVGVAPVKPAEFVIVRIGLWTAHADD